MTELKTDISQRERWLPIAQQFFATQFTHTSQADTEVFVDEVFQYVSHVAHQGQTAVLRIMTNYYEDGRLIHALCDQESVGTWGLLIAPIRSHIGRTGLPQNEVIKILNQTLNKLAVAIQTHQYQISLATLVETIIQNELLNARQGGVPNDNA